MSNKGINHYLNIVNNNKLSIIYIIHLNLEHMGLNMFNKYKHHNLYMFNNFKLDMHNNVNHKGCN